MIGAWAVYQMGWTKNRGAVDNNNRYLVEVAELKKGKVKDSDAILTTEDLAKLTAISKVHPKNADLILKSLKIHGCQFPRFWWHSVVFLPLWLFSAFCLISSLKSAALGPD